jgi:DNA-binding NtrC family response regulator
LKANSYHLFFPETAFRVRKALFLNGRLILSQKREGRTMDRPRIFVFATGENFLDQLKKIAPHATVESSWPGAENNFEWLMDEKHPDIVIIYSIEEGTQKSLQLVRKIRGSNKTIPIIFITEHSSEQIAIAALRSGVNDYYKFPFSKNLFLKAINRFSGNTGTSFTLPDTHQVDQKIIGDSLSMQELKEYITRVAATDSTVLITGETGTGKELAAEMIHLQSHRKEKPLIRLNCSALPENLVESELFGYERGAFTGAIAPQKGKLMAANGGDIFFDEIGDMNGYAQAKILRSIEYKEINPLGSNHSVPVDFRIIAATNRNPEELILEGKFRKDLYYRLNVARVNMPPLRERIQDIPELVTFAIKKLNHKFGRNLVGLTDEAMELLLRYDWPGNVRELMNLLEATFINLPQKAVTHGDLPKMFRKHFSTLNQIPTDEKKQILTALLETKWNKSSAAQKLNWSRMTLYRKMNKYNIAENGKLSH